MKLIRSLVSKNIDRVWEELLNSEASRSRAINANIREIKEALRRRYGEAANACERSLQAIAVDLAALDGELESQIVQIETLANRISEIMTQQLPMIANLEQDCKDAGCEESDYTVYTTDDLEFEGTLVKEAVAKKKAFVNNQVRLFTLIRSVECIVQPDETRLRLLHGQRRSSHRPNWRNLNLLSGISIKTKQTS